jgi:hypothetical protein
MFFGKGQKKVLRVVSAIVGITVILGMIFLYLTPFFFGY